MFDPASRYALVDQPQLNPAFDFITHNTNGPFVDTGLTINKFDSMFAEAHAARVYISVETLRELAEGAGLFEPYKDSNIEYYKDGYADGMVDGRRIVEEEHGTARDLVAQLGGLGLHVAPVGVDAPAESEPQSAATAPERAADAEQPAAPAAAKRATRQGNGASRNNRSARVPSDSSNDDAFRI